MKTCPKCNATVDDNFDICWNCQYCFSQDRKIDINDLDLVCPKCNHKISSDLHYCPVCAFNFDTLDNSAPKMNDIQEFKCLRCHIPMNYKGNFCFNGGATFGAAGNLFELFVNKEYFKLYYCPQCGKVEFFIA